MSPLRQSSDCKHTHTHTHTHTHIHMTYTSTRLDWCAWEQRSGEKEVTSIRLASCTGLLAINESMNQSRAFVGMAVRPT